MRPLTEKQIARRKVKARELRLAADRLEAALVTIVSAAAASRRALINVKERAAMLSVVSIEFRTVDTIRRLRNRADDWDPS